MPVSLLWKRRVGRVAVEEQRQLEEYLDENGIVLPAAMECKSDPRLLNQIQFRDSVRQHYDCVKHKLQIATAVMIVPAPADDPNSYEWSYRLFTCDWDLVRKDLDSTFRPGNEPYPNVVKVEVRLRLLDTENDERVYESLDGPPPLYDMLPLQNTGVESVARSSNNEMGKSTMRS